MANYQRIITELVTAGSNPTKAIEASVKSSGKEPFGYFPPRVPEELIYAAGYLPVGMWGGRTQMALVDRYLQGFCCTVMRANLEMALRGSYGMLKGVMIPALCDSLKCVIENWKVAVPTIPAIGVVYPQNRKLPEGIDYCIDEMQRICRELSKISGQEITDADLEAAFEVYEQWRQAMREFTVQAARFPKLIGAKTRHLIIKAAQFMDKAEHLQLICQLNDELKQLPNEPYDGLRVVVTGLLAEPLELLDLFEENEIAFVADDLSQESRQFRTICRKEGSVLEKMAYMIADIEGDTFLYDPDKKKGDLLVDMVRQNKADAVVVLMMKFCDPEEFDYPIIKQELESAEIPALYLETDQQLASVEQLRTRVQSFAEMLTV